jgi:hypothetical protein
MRHARLLVALSFTLALSAGCRPYADSYETCFNSADCTDTRQSCFTINNAGVRDDICSNDCSSDADCPSDDLGRSGSCTSAAGTGANICVQRCTADLDCYGSRVCEGGLCLPNAGGGGGFVNNYRSCLASSDCRDPSLECVTFDVAGRREAVCTTTFCSRDDDCPFDSRGGRGACLNLGGSTACWERCNFRADCEDTFDWDCTTNVGGFSAPPPGVCAPR